MKHETKRKRRIRKRKGVEKERMREKEYIEVSPFFVTLMPKDSEFLLLPQDLYLLFFSFFFYSVISPSIFL